MAEHDNTQPEEAQPETPQPEAAQPETPQPEAAEPQEPQPEGRRSPGASDAAAQDAPEQAAGASGERAPAEEAAEQPADRPAEEPSQAPAPEPAATAGDEAGAPGERPGGAGDGVARAKPAVPGAHLEVDIVPEGEDPLGHGEEYEDPYAHEQEPADGEAQAEDEPEHEQELVQPISTAAIDLASGARYRATGKRKTAIARVTLRPGTGAYVVNGRSLEEHFPRATLQRNIRQPLEAVGYEQRMDVVARLGGGGISAQAGALRHGVSRALLEADPNLRGELKRRGFLTRDSRAKERKKAGLKKARKRPQFSKR
jgi:small subunit ribosomal protein S9